MYASYWLLHLKQIAKYMFVLKSLDDSESLSLSACVLNYSYIQMYSDVVLQVLLQQ